MKEPKENVLFSDWTGFTENNKVGVVIYTEPIAKQRPKFTKNGHAYTPDKTRFYEQKIATVWKASHRKIITGDISLKLIFGMPIPKSMSKANRTKAIEGLLRPNKKPDIDNLVKAVCDALNEVAFWDDRQIVLIYAEKKYAEEPFVKIEITEK